MTLEAQYELLHKYIARHLFLFHQSLTMKYSFTALQLPVEDGDDVHPNRFDAPNIHHFLQSLPTNYDRQCVMKFIPKTEKRMRRTLAERIELEQGLFRLVFGLFDQVVGMTAEQKFKIWQEVEQAQVASRLVHDRVADELQEKQTIATTNQATKPNQWMDNKLQDVEGKLVKRFRDIFLTAPLSPIQRQQLEKALIEYEKQLVAMEAKTMKESTQFMEDIFRNSNVMVHYVKMESITFVVKRGRGPPKYETVPSCVF